MSREKMMKTYSLRLRLGGLLLLLTLLPARATGTDRANTLAAGGQAHSLAVQEDGTVLVWGDNSAGQLGLGGDVAEIRKPTAVEGVSAVSVAAGEDFSAALRYDGAVYTWGHGVHAAPVQAAIDQVAAIAAGGEVVLALKTDGTVWPGGGHRYLRRAPPGPHRQR